MDRNFDTLDLPKRTEAAKGEWTAENSAQAHPGSEALCYQAGLKGLGDPVGKQSTVVPPKKAVQSCCGFRIRVSSMGHSRQGGRQRHREVRHLPGHTACEKTRGDRVRPSLKGRDQLGRTSGVS